MYLSICNLCGSAAQFVRNACTIYALEMLNLGGGAALVLRNMHNARQAHSKPVLEAFFAWLDTVEPAGGSNLAKAVQYAKNEKKYLCRFLESGDIPIDNNRAENAVRPFCVGRKNWLFSASVKGAEASAMMYSIAATACANGMNVEQYLTELFRGEAGTVVLPW